MKIKRVNRGKGHYYIDEDTGDRVPGVTTIRDEGTPKKALINWAAEATADYAVDNWDRLSQLPVAQRLKEIKGGRYEKRDEAANRGTQVHGLAERLVHGDEVVVPEAIRGYVESYVSFLNDFQVTPVHVEVLVYSERHRHVGTLDLIADILLPDIPEYEHYPRGEDGFVRALLDIKTSRSGIFGDTALQLAAYRHSEWLIPGDTAEPIVMPEVDFVGGIHVRADGYDLVPVTAGEDEYRDFLYVKEVGRFDRNSRDLVGEPIIPPTTSRYALARVDEAVSA